MMSTRANAVVAKLCEELQSVEKQTLALIGIARSRRIADAHGRIVSAFELTDAQRALVNANVKRWKGWVAAAAALIRRRGSTPVDDFRALAEMFVQCISMTRTGNAVQLESHWREESSMVLAERAAELMSVVSRLRGDEIGSADLREPFHVAITREDDGRWRVESTARGMHAVNSVSIPFTAQELETFIRTSCGPRRSAAPADLKPLETFGRSLFETIFSGAAGVAYDALRQTQLCLTLRFDGPDARVPWELLHDGSGFLALSERTGLLRAVRGSSPGLFSLRTPLRILLTSSNAPTRPSLDAERERQEIDDALAPLVYFGAVEIDVAPDGTMNTVRRILRAAVESGRPYDLWHFTGHGGFDQAEGTTALSMVTTERRERMTYGHELRELLRAHPQLKLVILNACEGGRAGTMNEDLVSAAMAGGASAVVAMQFKILDSAAISFAAELYGALADGDPIDKAVASARREVFFTPNYTDWIAPVVFVADGGAARS